MSIFVQPLFISRFASVLNLHVVTWDGPWRYNQIRSLWCGYPMVLNLQYGRLRVLPLPDKSPLMLIRLATDQLLVGSKDAVCQRLQILVRRSCSRWRRNWRSRSQPQLFSSMSRWYLGVHCFHRVTVFEQRKEAIMVRLVQTWTGMVWCTCTPLQPHCSS